MPIRISSQAGWRSERRWRARWSTYEAQVQMLLSLPGRNTRTPLRSHSAKLWTTKPLQEAVIKTKSMPFDVHIRASDAEALRR
jgi:hypothetical protein